MAKEQFLLVRPDGQTEKAKAADKIDTGASSFFAPIARVPSVTGFDILGGFAYIGGAFFELGDTFVNMGIGGNYETSPIPAAFWNVALFSLDENGVIVMSEGNGPNAVRANVVIPDYPAGNMPIATVFFKDNGGAGNGTILTIADTDVIDQRAFFYGSYGKSATVSDLVQDLKVFANSPASTQLVINSGSFYFSSGEYVPFAGATINLGTGGGNQAPPLPVGFYNKALVCLNHLGLVQIFYSTPNAVLANVPIPTNGKNAFPLAIVNIKDNGGGIGGSLVPITSADILDARAFFNNFLGELPTTGLDYCKAKSFFPNQKKVLVNAGVVYPKPAVMVQFPQTTIDFSTGPYQTPALAPGAYLRILLCLDAGGNPLTFLSTPQAIQGNLVDPPIPKTVVAIAYIDVQDDGSAIAGSIRPIDEDHIRDIRPWLGPAAASGSTPSPSDMYGDYLNSATWMQGFFEDFQGTTFIDTVNSTATIDTLVNNYATLAPGQTLVTTNVYDNYQPLVTISRALVYATASDTSSNLKVEITNDGTTFTQISGGVNHVFDFTTLGLTLKVRFTNVGGSTITLNDYGIFYDDDATSPSFLFANSRLPLNQVIVYGNPLIVGNKITLDEGRNYPIGEKTLLVYKNGVLLEQDQTLTLSPSYKENDLTSILVNPAPAPGDRYHFVIPAGLFGQTVQQFQSTLNALIPAQYIVDQLIKTPSGGTTTTVQSGIGNLSLVTGGKILLESQELFSTSPIQVSGRDVYFDAKVHSAKCTVPTSFNGSMFVISDNFDYSFTSITFAPTSGFGTTATGVTISAANGNVAFRNCVFQNLNTGINVTGNTAKLTFKDCKFINCTTDIVSKDNVYIDNCTFDGTGGGAAGVTVRDGSTVLGSLFKVKTGTALTVSGVGTIVRGNTITSVAAGLVASSTANEGVISGNRVTSCTGTGIQVDGNRNVVNSNVSKTNQTGLSINGSENMVAGNVVTDNSVDGIVIGISATDNQIGDNVLARNPT